MGIIKRIKDIFSANANAALDKIEDPEVMIDQYIREIESTLGEVKAKTADAMVVEERSQQRVAGCKNTIEQLEGYAVKALAENNEEDAAKFVSKKFVYEEQLTGYEQALAVANENVAKMREIHDRLAAELISYKEKRDTLKTKMAVVKTSEKVSQVAGMSAKADDTLLNFSRMEEKIDGLMLKANALSKLESPKDEIVDLKEKYDSVDKSKKLQDALDELKKKVS